MRVVPSILMVVRIALRLAWIALLLCLLLLAGWSGYVDWRKKGRP